MYDHELHGLAPTEFRQHPVTQLIRDSAYHGRRGLPSRAELDALQVSSTERRRVREACEEAAEVHDEGDQQVAWGLGDKAAADVIGRLDEEQQHPDYYAAPDPLEETEDPATLAAAIWN